VVIADVLSHKSLAMACIEHNHMVEQITAARADEAFSDAILPGASDASSFGLNPEAPNRLNNAVTKVRTAVEDQVAGRGVVGKRFAQLLRYPCAGWIPRDIEMQNLTPTVGDNEKTVEHAKCHGWHREEVHRGDSLAMVRQERHPFFCRLRIPGRFPHPVQHSSFRDFEAEHLEFAMNARRTPSRILRDHAEYHLPQFFACGPSSHAGPAPRDPLPVQLEPCSMPTDNGFGLNNENRPLPARPDSAQEAPEELVGQHRMSPRSLPDHE